MLRYVNCLLVNRSFLNNNTYLRQKPLLDIRMKSSNLFKSFVSELQNRTHYLTEDSVRFSFFACMLKQDNYLDNYILESPYALPITGAPTHITISNGLAAQSPKAKKPKQELDMYYHDNAKNESWCIEIKFHRNPFAKTAFAHTDAAGSIFNDIKRLQLIHPLLGRSIHRLLVYVTDDEMHNYFNVGSIAYKNKDYRDILKAFYNSPLNATQSYCFDKNNISIPQTFLDSANNSFTQPHVNPLTVNVKKKVDSSFITTCPSFKQDSKTGNRSCHILIYEVI